MFKTCCGTKECVKDVWHVRNNMLKVLRCIEGVSLKEEGGACALSGQFLLSVQAMHAPPLVPSLPFLFLFPLERGGDMEGKKRKGEENMDVLTY